MVWRMLNVFSVGITLDASTARHHCGCVRHSVFHRLATDPIDNDVNWVTVSLILWTLVPIAVMYIVSLSRPATNPKFLLLATPAFFILCRAWVIDHLPGVFLHHRHGNYRQSVSIRIDLFGIGDYSLFAAAGPLTSVQNYFSDPQYARDDYRADCQTDQRERA